MGNQISYASKPHTLDLGARGKVTGLQLDDKARRYTAVPYALPPTGEHRWRKPRPLPSAYTYTTANGQPLDATAFRSPCLQEARQVGNRAAKLTGDASEDCLVVNIWTPVEATEISGGATKKWPVMVWIHGGWFQIGDALQSGEDDPTELISTGGLNAIIVAVSYRLNVFGFLSTHALADEDPDQVTGNFGLWDQRLALEWVYENIADFGGDVDNITLAGRSAGAYSVEAQLLYDFRAPETAKTGKLFRRVFMSSNAIPAQPKTVEDAEAQFDELCEYFEISPDLAATGKLAKLRQIRERDLVAALPHLKHHTFRPVTDDVFFHSNMIEYFQNGSLAAEFKRRQMKVLIGEVQNEETLYAQFSSPDEPNFEALRLQVANYYAPATTDRALKQYDMPATADLADWALVVGNVLADGQVRASTRCFIDDLHSHGVPVSDIWRYKVAYRCSFVDESVAPASFGVAHAMDAPVWNFGVACGATPAETDFLHQWSEILFAFMHGTADYDFGTREIEDMKVATAERSVEVQRDERYRELIALGAIFGNRAS